MAEINKDFILPVGELLYEVDLKNRTVSSPEFLGVSNDYKSETIYFVVDRFHEEIDLSQMNCAIHYINANDKKSAYDVPFYSLNALNGDEQFVRVFVSKSNYVQNKYYIKNSEQQYELFNEKYDANKEYYLKVTSPKIIFPWSVGGDITEESGIVNFSVCFYSLDETKLYYLYSLNTQPKQSIILKGIHSDSDVEGVITPNDYEKIYSRLISLEKEGAKMLWNELSNSDLI